jgi:hypothetical protein
MASYDLPSSAPEKVDMRDVLWPVEDTGEIYAAPASAAVTALEYHCNRMGVEPTNLSSMFVYYNARQASGDAGSNAGTTLQAAMKAIAAYGACREMTWPLDPSTVTVKPPPHAYEEAKKFAAVRAFAPADVIEALALRYPVPCVITLPDRCLQQGDTGMIPAPTPEELRDADGLVNHSLVLVGYDKNARVFLARNCWGESWGDQGHCRISFDVMNVIAPQGRQRMWVIATADSRSDAYAAMGVLPAAPPPPPAAPERLSDLAAKLRQEIRGDMQREIADATKRIKDMVGRGAGAPTPQSTCSRCGGNGRCRECGGQGCGACGNGRCAHCGGSGTE